VSCGGVLGVLVERHAAQRSMAASYVRFGKSRIYIYSATPGACPLLLSPPPLPQPLQPRPRVLQVEWIELPTARNRRMLFKKLRRYGMQ
jgi:hypothetical protein